MTWIWTPVIAAAESILWSRQRSRFGLGVGRDSVRGVLVARGRVIWRGEVEVNLQESEHSSAIREAVTRLLRSAPTKRGATVSAAIGPASSQLCRLSGLPGAKHARMRAALVREGASRLFVANGGPLMTSGVWVAEDGGWWAAAYERSIVAGILAACRDQRLRVRSILPSIAVIAGVLLEHEKPGAFEWRDADVTAAVTYGREGQLESVRRFAARTEEANAADATGDNRAPDRWADAIGAALAHPASELAIDPTGSAADSEMSSRTGLRVAFTALGAVAAFSILGSPVIALWQARQATARLEFLAAGRRAAVKTERELAAVDGELEALAAQANQRRSMTLLLAALTDALPESTSLVSLRLDEKEGSLTALAPHGANVLVELEKLPEIANPQIVGAITREAAILGAAPPSAPDVEAQALERVTVRFRWGPGHRGCSSPTRSPDCHP